jgi:hypothetical protein
LFPQHGICAIEQEDDEDDGDNTMVHMRGHDSRCGRSERGCQLQCHGQANVGNVTLNMHRRGCGGGSNHCHEARGDGILQRHMKKQYQDGGDDDAATNAGNRAEPAGKKSNGDQDDGLGERQAIRCTTIRKPGNARNMKAELPILIFALRQIRTCPKHNVLSSDFSQKKVLSISHLR